MYVNVAKGKPASQSSLSIWSTEIGAAGAVTGVMPDTFGFHTDFEDKPWWMVDLLDIYAIEQIVLHNRLDMLPERASTCQVEISQDGSSWTFIHSGHVYFLGGTLGAPLILPLGCRMAARYVRVSLAEAGYLHLAQVEVYALAGSALKSRYGLHEISLKGDYSSALSVEKNMFGMAYFMEGDDLNSGEINLIGLRLTHIGRLGNQLIQFINATIVARRLGLKYIKVMSKGLLNLREPFIYDGVCYIPDVSDVEENGIFLAGDFFFQEDLESILQTATAIERQQIIHDVVRPYLLQKLSDSDDIKYDNELTIHFRAGDIFADANAASGYTQPPFSFYKTVIRHAVEQQFIKCVRLVFEDFGNPCIQLCISFLQDEGIAFRTQNGTLQEDLAALINARHLVFGFGTFGIGVALLSNRIETVYCFEGFNDQDYRKVPAVLNTITVYDRQSAYTKVGEWKSTQAQRQLMIEYPEAALEI